MTRRILILDEDREVLESLCDALRGVGMRLEVHASAEAAWASIDRDPPDMVVVSSLTAGLVGRPFIDDLRQHFGDRVRRVVTNCAPDGTENAPAGAVAGLEARLARPMNHPQLVQRAVSRLLNGTEPSEDTLDANRWDEAGEVPPPWESPAVAYLDQFPDGILITDSEGLVRFLNPAAARLLGAVPSEVLHRPLGALSQVPDLCSVAELPSSGPADAAGAARVAGPGGKGTLEVRVARCEADGPGDGGRLIVVRDVGVQVRIDRLRDEYLAVLAAELRSPLTVLRNLLTALPEDDRGLADVGGRQVRRLEHQIDKLLLLATRDDDEDRDREPDRVDVRKVVEEAVDTCCSQAEDQGTVFKLLLPETPVLVCCSRDDLRRCVFELAENAVKFTPSGGIVCVAVRQRDGHAEVRVQDTGVGIDARFHEAVFDASCQLERPVTLTSDGAGLGLALARGMVETWGGTIQVESEPTLGSTFTLSIPSAPGEEPEPSGEEEELAMTAIGEIDDD